MTFTPAPFFDASFVLHEDDDLLALNKPPGMSSQAANPDHPDDVVTRARRFLEAREGREVPLYVHQRLDRETSGVLLLSKSARANRSLADQFGDRSIRKEYVACVRGYVGGSRRLEHTLSELSSGRVHVLPPGDPAGDFAALELVPLERRDGRALLGIRLETGRTHQIRVQLAAHGTPVAGDILYGDEPARRLLLHASALRLVHPATGEPLSIRAPVPAAFKRYLEGRDVIAPHEAAPLRALLAEAMLRRAGLIEARHDARAIDAFRLLHGAAEGCPALAVDVYGDHAVAHLYEKLSDDVEAAVVRAVHALGVDGVYLKRRPEQANELAETRTAELAPAGPVAGTAAADPLLVREHGVVYEVRLGDGLSTGIFLDQRENRARVRAHAAERRVLNLFAYTGAFSAAALVGGAREVVSVDAAAPAVAWAERNATRTGHGDRHRAVRADVFAWLDAAQALGESFDLVVCDPPTYSTTRTSRFRSGADWVGLAESVFRVLAAPGVAFFCSNDRRLTEAAFRKRIAMAADRAGIRVSLRQFDPPADFPIGRRGSPSLLTVRATRSES